MRVRIALVILTGLLASALPAPAWAQIRAERLAVGEQKTFKPGYAVGDIAIANPDVCDFRVVSARREVMLIATGQGFTTLTVWDQRGVKRDEIAIEVVSREFAKLLNDLAELLRPYPGVTVRTLGNRVALSGTVASAQELEAVREIASAVEVVSTVTVRSAAVQPPPAGAETAAATGSVVPDPAPPPPSRRPVTNAPTPVPLTPGTASSSRTPASAAQPAAAASPPAPNVSTSGAARAATPAEPSAAVGNGAIEYLVEIYETPTSAPPPEVAGPQGKKLFTARLRTDVGIEVRQLVNVGPKTATPAQMRGISIGLTPSTSEGSIQTEAVIDTNLPLGPYEQKKNPVWLRCTASFESRPGQARYLNEHELAGSAQPVGAPPATGSGSSAGGRAAATAIDAGTQAATSHVPGGAYIPSFGGLFGGGGSSEPKVRPTMLLIVITPSASRWTPRDEPSPGL